MNSIYLCPGSCCKDSNTTERALSLLLAHSLPWRCPSMWVSGSWWRVPPSRNPWQCVIGGQGSAHHSLICYPSKALGKARTWGPLPTGQLPRKLLGPGAWGTMRSQTPLLPPQSPGRGRKARQKVPHPPQVGPSPNTKTGYIVTMTCVSGNRQSHPLK